MIIDYAEPGMILGQDITDQYGKLLLEKGMALTESYIKRLRNLGIDKISVSDHEATLLKQQQAISTELRTELTLCFQSFSSLQTSFLANDALTNLYLEQVERIICTIVHQASEQMTDIMNTQVWQPNENDIVHAINVCLLSIITGLQLNLPKSVLYDLALGALLHDIGKFTLPCINGTLFDSTKLHTLYGRNLLLKSKLSPTIAQIVAEHHETLNGTGLPLGLTSNKIHHLSKIVALANFFDRKMTTTVIDNAPQEEVFEYMLANADTLFDSSILEAFTSAIPLYPVGCMVLLNTNRTAYVMKNHLNNSLRPIVKMNTSNGQITTNLLDEPTLDIIKIIEY